MLSIIIYRPPHCFYMYKQENLSSYFAPSVICLLGTSSNLHRSENKQVELWLVLRKVSITRDGNCFHFLSEVKLWRIYPFWQNMESYTLQSRLVKTAKSRRGLLLELEHGQANFTKHLLPLEKKNQDNFQENHSTDWCHFP